MQERDHDTVTFYNVALCLSVTSLTSKLYYVSCPAPLGRWSAAGYRQKRDITSVPRFCCNGELQTNYCVFFDTVISAFNPILLKKHITHLSSLVMISRFCCNNNMFRLWHIIIKHCRCYGVFSSKFHVPIISWYAVFLAKQF